MPNGFARRLAVFTSLLALALSPAPAHAVLERVGPNSPTHFLPLWYQDQTGLAFEFCTPLNQAEYAGGWCLLLPTTGNVPGNIPGDVTPEVFPGAFSGEHFYFATDSKGNYSYVQPPGGPTPAATSGKVTVTMAVEAAFLGAIGPGLGQVFGRHRIKVTPLPLTGNYRVYTPYKVQDIPGLAGDKIFVSEDIGANCAAFTYDCALQTSVGPFLVPSNTPGGNELPPVTGPVPGKLYLADPARVGPVTGSLNGSYTLQSGRVVNANVIVIEAPDGQVIYESYDFSSMGRIMKDVIPSRLAVNRASYGRDAGGSIRVDAYATGEPTLQPRLPNTGISGKIQPQLNFFDAPCGGTLDLNGVIQPPYTAPVGQPSFSMTNAGNVYWGQSAPAAIPAGVCLVDLNAHDAGGAVVPVYLPGPLGDQVFVTAAVYDPSNGGSLSVRASSSDVLTPPVLSLGAFGDLAANVPLVNDLAYVTSLHAPPATVRVHSQEGGVAELQVKVGSRAATGVTLVADKNSPQPPGTAVVFTAQGAGAAEYLYRFWLHDGATWSIVRDWSASSNWVLPTSTVSGNYQVKVDVWAGLQPTAPDTTSGVFPFAISVLPATSATLAVAPPSPQMAGSTITFSASCVGGSAPCDFQFWLFDGAVWTLAQPWGGGSTWVMPVSTPAGTYAVSAEARTSPLVTRDVWSNTITGYVISPLIVPATGATVTAGLPSPQTTGTPVAFNAACSGTADPCDFQFWLFNGSTWSLAQAWGGGPTWTMPGSTPAGTYAVSVEVRTSSLVARDVWSNTITGYQIAAAPVVLPTPATGATVIASLASPQTVGIPVAFNAACSGTADPCDFQFWVFNGTTWSLAQAWGGGPTWTMLGSTPAGTYAVSVETRTSSLVARDVWSNTITGYQIAAAPVVLPTPATGATVTAGLASPQTAGTPVAFNAACSGTADPCDFQFWLFDGSTWSLAQAWGGGQTWTMLGSTPAGTYAVSVEARTSSLVARDVWSNTITGYQIAAAPVVLPTPATGATVTAGLASPQTAGTPVAFNAACSGTADPCDFQFWLFDGSTWSLAQAWGGGPTWTMLGSTPAGTYALSVEVRTSALVTRDVWSNTILGYQLQ